MISTKGKQSPKKGSGKFKDSSKSSTKMKPIEVPESPTKEPVLSFPLLKTMDNSRTLPRYSAILNRTEEEGVGMDDLDALQLELEALLSAVVVRSRVLREEIQVLSNAEEKRDKKGKLSINKPPLSPGKKIKLQDRPVKKLKEMPGKIRSEVAQAPLPIKFTKVKHVPSATLSQSPLPLPEHDQQDLSKMEAPKIVLPKNDTPNKFWASVEPYCADITPEDIKLLEELIQEHENDSEYYKIPALGRHYSMRWSQEDLMEEQEASSNDSKSKSNGSNAEVNNLLKKADKAVDGTTGSTPASGPLTQRLISALMEENIMVPLSEPFDPKKCRSGENAAPRSGLFRNFAVSGAANFERIVRKELEEQGIFEYNESPDPEDDEILQELKRCQEELKLVNAHNVQQLKRLLRLANEEMVRQDLKRKLQQADNEVLEMYRKVTSAKQKKKPLSKKEQDAVWKALKDRDAILMSLDSL